MSERASGAAERGWMVVGGPDSPARTRHGRRRPRRPPSVPVTLALLTGCVGLGLSVDRLGLDTNSDPAVIATDQGIAPASPSQVAEPTATNALSLDARMELAEVLARARVVAGPEADLASDVNHRAQTDADRVWVAPTIGRTTSSFQPTRIHPILRRTRAHRGVDVSAPWGAPISTPAAGVVVEIGTGEELGRFVVVDHGSGVWTRYGHCSQILVSVGQSLRAGYPIALVGETGLATGPHVHYEVIVEGRHVDPLEHRWR